MITYNRSAFGVNLIFRIHGSAVYRSVVPSLLSVAFFFIIRNVLKTPGGVLDFGEDLGHPYAIGVLVASTTFLIVFRANQGYSRYWEAASASHHMMSKWMDATVHSCVYHLQCDHYKDIKPPSYFDYPELNHLFMTRDRERGIEYNDDDDTERRNSIGPFHDSFDTVDGGEDMPMLSKMKSGRWKSSPVNQSFYHPNSNNNESKTAAVKEHKKEQKMRAVTKSINYIADQKKRDKFVRSNSLGDLDKMLQTDTLHFDDVMTKCDLQGKPFPLSGRPRLDGNWGALYAKHEGTNSTRPFATFVDPKDMNKMDPRGFASIQGGRTPPLFLQELAHLSSLLVAVALSTLRNDIEGAESPLAFYQPGEPWPEVDPDKDEWFRMNDVSAFFKNLNNFLGMGRTAKEQTAHNAARPLPVIGGVSDNEIHFLQMARGPYAKTQLCWNWLSEFCIREHLAGSMGKVGPPIISRIIQFLGDGMIYYNHARKIMFIPFPFVHAQLSVLFVLVMVPCIPFLMDQYTDQAWVGASLTFFTVMCLSGIHEVARELENPFRNVPNELPLVTLQAHYNEALITMFSGYHPDHFWDGERVLRKRSKFWQSRHRNSNPRTSAANNANKDNKNNKGDAGGTGGGAPIHTPTKSNRSKIDLSDEAPQAPRPPPLPRKHTFGTSSDHKDEKESDNTTGKEKSVDSMNGVKSFASVSFEADEIARLKKQLQEQQKLIEKLAAKVFIDPKEETEKMERIIDDEVPEQVQLEQPANGVEPESEPIINI